MAILPDHLSPGLKIVFCGTAAGNRSAQRGHYYSGPGNDFWRYLFEADMTPVQLRPQEDARITEYGMGLTDLAKDVAASTDVGLRPHYNVDGFILKIEKFRPVWVAFHGKEAAKAVARHLQHRGQLRLGVQSWDICASQVYVLPSASGANRDSSRLEGKSSRLEWFKELTGMASTGTGGSARSI